MFDKGKSLYENNIMAGDETLLYCYDMLTKSENKFSIIEDIPTAFKREENDKCHCNVLYRI